MYDSENAEENRSVATDALWSEWDFSPEGDAVEDDEQSDAPGFERTIKHLFNRPKDLKVKPKKLF